MEPQAPHEFGNRIPLRVRAILKFCRTGARVLRCSSAEQEANARLSSIQVPAKWPPGIIILQVRRPLPLPAGHSGSNGPPLLLLPAVMAVAVAAKGDMAAAPRRRRNLIRGQQSQSRRAKTATGPPQKTMRCGPRRRASPSTTSSRRNCRAVPRSNAGSGGIHDSRPSVKIRQCWGIPYG